MLKNSYDNTFSIIYWCAYLGALTRVLGYYPLSNGWFAFILPSIWIINFTVDKLYDYLRGDLLLPNYLKY